MQNKSKATKTVMKIQKALIGDTVLIYNKDRSIMGELPMDKKFEVLFGDRYKVYCLCKYRESDGFLEIGEEVMADW